MSSEQASVSADHEQGDATSPLKVFVVEDTASMQIALRDLLCAAADAEILAMESSEALAMEWANANEGRWDLAIVDLTLADGDGFSIVRRLKQQPRCGVVVVFSGYVTEVIRRHCFALGADAVFHKTESSELAQFVETLAGPAAAPDST
jgi:two-component system, OmpR family, response regulator